MYFHYPLAISTFLVSLGDQIQKFTFYYEIMSFLTFISSLAFMTLELFSFLSFLCPYIFIIDKVFSGSLLMCVNLWHMSVCVCVHFCVYVCMCAGMLILWSMHRSQRENLGVSLSFHVGVRVSSYRGVYFRLSGCHFSKDSPVSPSHPTIGVLQLQMCTAVLSFTWLLGIQTWVLILTLQVTLSTVFLSAHHFQLL